MPLEAGKLADLVVMDGDPFEDFESLVRTVSVMRGGVLYEQPELIASVPAVAAEQTHWAGTGRTVRNACCGPAH
ncbi:hypothetical protein [Streptomyces sp. NPDC002788]